MKKINYLFIIAFTIVALVSCKKDDAEETPPPTPPTLAPFTIKVDGEALLNNAIKVYTTVDDSANMELEITNNTDSSMDLRIAVVSKTAPDTADAELCFGVCYAQIYGRTIYPLNDAFTLASKATSTPGQAHVHNKDTLFGDVEFVFEVFRVDENLNKIEDGITFTYKYDAP